MKTLDCENPTIALRLPPCAGSEPTAELTRAKHISVPLTRVTQAEDGLFHFSFPDPFPANIPTPPRGVWNLSAETGCGCYTALVYVNCPAIMFNSTHYPSLLTGPSTECCADENDILFHVDTLKPPTVTVDGYLTAEMLVNEAASYALQLNADVTGTYTITNASGVELAAGTFGPVGTTEYHDIDFNCATYILKRPN